ncbi:MAG: aminotransferase class IV [Bacteroidetes bacterium]|nr:aminotransferase class IV [Bacteroidota bacterium]
MNEFFIFNGQFFSKGKPVISAGSAGLRYGDGLFETMRLHKGRILNVDFHFERLFGGRALLFSKPSKSLDQLFLKNLIAELLKRNNHQGEARIRLMLFNGAGENIDFKNDYSNFIIETWHLPCGIALNERGLEIDIFLGVTKACDQFANLKSNNFLPYLLAGRFAKDHQLSDAVVLNSFGRISDTSVANIFMLKGKSIFTPPLQEGCVAGTMRRWVLENLLLPDLVISEKELTIDDLLFADEVFLTNAIHPVRWVKRFREKEFTCNLIPEIFKQVKEGI